MVALRSLYGPCRKARDVVLAILVAGGRKGLRDHAFIGCHPCGSFGISDAKMGNG